MKENDKVSKIAHEKIDVTNSETVQRWCSELQCNEMRLKNAIRAVGPSAEAVRKYMDKKF